MNPISTGPEVGLVIKTVREVQGWYGFLMVGQDEVFFHQRQGRDIISGRDGPEWRRPYHHISPPSEGTRIVFIREKGTSKAIAWGLEDEYIAAKVA